MQDIWGHITELIYNDNDICHLMMSCKWISKCRFYFYEPNEICKIKKSQWFNHFNNIFNYHNSDKLPLFITHLTFGSYKTQRVL